MALSPDEKKIYLNQDTTAGEADGAMYFPVKYLTGLDNTTSATVNLYFRNPNNTTSTRVIILITTGFIKEFYTQFVNEINFGENAVITLFVRNLSVSTTQGGSDFVYVNAFAGAIVTAIEDLKIASDLDVAELITIGSSAEIGPHILMLNDENSLRVGISNGTNALLTGSADGDVVISSVGDHNVLIGQNDAIALTIDTNGDSNFNRKFTVTGDTDASFQGDIVYFGGTTSMNDGKIYHYKSDGTWEGADASTVATSDGLLAVALGAASDTNGMLLRGMVTLDHDPGAVGDVLFLKAQAGTATAPSGNNNIVRVIGYCLNASNGQIWFNPDNTFVEVTA